MKKIVSRFAALSLTLTCILTTFLASNAAFFTDQELRALEKSFEEKCDEIRTAVVHEEYFDGGCAEWTSDQLILNGIGYWYKGYYCYGYDHGRYWFSQLDDGAVTESGYTQVKYPGNDCLYDIVYEFGGCPVYNIVVSWEIGNDDWPEAGHVLYIWCIYDGYVYYSDTFDQYFYKAGHIIKQPLSEFMEIYEATNGAILGAVHFEGAEAVHYKPGERVYTEFTALEGCEVRRAPTLALQQEDTLSHQAQPGEAFAVKGIYTDEAGARWLKIDGGMWVSAEQAVKTGNYSTLSLTGVSVPTQWCLRHAFDMTGTITSSATALTAVTAAIIDSGGNTVLGGDYRPNGQTFSLAEIDEHIYFEHLKEGAYRYVIKASNEYETALLLDETFSIIDATWSQSDFYEYNAAHRCFEPADCNTDGVVDETDFQRLLGIINGEPMNTAAYFFDVNADGYYNLTDLALIAQQIQMKSQG